ncbi:MAG: tyrosine--tRNA ligase [Bacteroidales bacterium]|nr:tyrosine--tRNA ligase [Bacteroidales bacterium]
MSFIDDLKWRGMIHDMMPGTEEQLAKEMTTAYVGIDPTADSLHIGHLVSIMILKHFQMAGHKPIALVGGATGMVGDPSGKSAERNLLDEKTLNHNKACIKAQLSKFLDFDSDAINAAELVDNYDWMKDFSFISFIRDIGKHITVNYMMAKDSVKKRFASDSREGMSFTEFSYQLMQGYDFYYLRKHKNCKLQMGGADQWGNITTGVELIRRIDGIEAEAFGLTCPLIKKADGTKFGKTEKGNVWLDPKLTSPYEFYQFWINTSDEDAERYIKIYTLLSKEEIENLIEEHRTDPGRRLLQSELAKRITIMVHGENAYNTAIAATQILFGKGTKEQLLKLDEKSFLEIFNGVPQFTISKDELAAGIGVLDLLAEKSQVFASKGEARRAITKENSLSINQEKVSDPETKIDTTYLLDEKYILVRKGKKNWFVLTIA